MLRNGLYIFLVKFQGFPLMIIEKYLETYFGFNEENSKMYYVIGNFRYYLKWKCHKMWDSYVKEYRQNKIDKMKKDGKYEPFSCKINIKK